MRVGESDRRCAVGGFAAAMRGRLWTTGPPTQTGTQRDLERERIAIEDLTERGGERKSKIESTFHDWYETDKGIFSTRLAIIGAASNVDQFFQLILFFKEGRHCPLPDLTPTSLYFGQ